MQLFRLDVLLTPSLAIFFLTLYASFKMTRSVFFSLPAACAKAGLFLLYFGVLFTGTFTFQDDWGYLEGGRRLFIHDVSVTNLAGNWDFVLSVANGRHFVYYLYNAYAFRLFGEGYYAPVAFNILLTVGIAWLGAHLAAYEFGLSRVREKVFFAFLLFHPDILAWSNVMNGKDILVLMLHILLLISISLLFRQRYKSSLALAIPVVLTLFFTRFYVPLLFGLALLLGMSLSKTARRRINFAFVVFLLVALALMWLGADRGLIAMGLISVRESVTNPVFGLLRFVLTPIPFNTESAYNFLNIPACFHWFLTPFALWGIIVIHRLRTPFARVFLFYIFAFSALYAVSSELAGPRHRVQMDYALACLQFIGLMEFLKTGHTQRGRQIQASSPITP